MSFTSEDLTKRAISAFDFMLELQQIGLRAMTMYNPIASGYLDSTTRSRSAGFGRFGGRTTEVHDTEEKVIGVGEEVLNVGTRMVPGKTTTVRRVVVESPVQQDVTLHTETVVLERRRPIATSGDDVLTEVTVQMSDFNEVPVVSKAVQLVEEVLVRKEVTARTETIRDTVKRDKLEIDQPQRLPVEIDQASRVPAVFDAAKKQEEKRRADEDKKQSLVALQAAGNKADQQSVAAVADQHSGIKAADQQSGNKTAEQSGNRPAEQKR